MTLTNSNKLTIGIFDSGVGGLSVWREIIRVLPQYNYLYLADTLYCPYGPRSRDEIIGRATSITDFLITSGASIVVVACNTATSAAISTLRKRYNIPFVGMEPAVKPAASLSKSGVIGVLATKGTLDGDLYQSNLDKYASDTKVIERVGEGLVPLVESGKADDPVTLSLLRSYLEPMIEQGADHIVLGCTHYPFLSEIIAKIVGADITIVDPAPAVARRLASVVAELNINDQIFLTRKVSDNISPELALRTKFFSTGSLQVLNDMAERILPGIPEENFIQVNV
ncbi:MAG: glutamate racemase [Bacteroidales bacterium]|jgi:glutamate racemase|nr:glutamate racemase [Bacteroidales bacterium]